MAKPAAPRVASSRGITGPPGTRELNRRLNSRRGHHGYFQSKPTETCDYARVFLGDRVFACMDVDQIAAPVLVRILHK